MSSEKLTRKEIREPDPFVRLSNNLWAKAVEKQKAIGIGVIAVLAIFVTVALLHHSAQSKRLKSGDALSRALSIAVEPTREEKPEPPEAGNAQELKTQKEKDEALAKALDEVRGQYPGTVAATTATLFKSDAQLNLGKVDEAAKGYEEFLASSQEGDPLRALALEGLGYVHESKKELDKALDAFDRMGREASGEPLKARAAYHRARVLEEQGKKQEAAASFQKVKDEFKEAAASRDAEARLVALAAQGVALPEKAQAPVGAKPSGEKH